MNPTVVVICVLACYVLGYKFYSGFLARRVFELRGEDHKTPAHTQRDDVDFLPTPPYVLFGHHYASIAGLGPILGPAVAVIWGWLPAMLWVVFGTLLIGAVHDFSALVLSARSKGLSIGTITEYLMGKRAKLLFLLIIFFMVSLAMGVFVLVLGHLFSPDGFPMVVTPTTMIMVLAMAVGYLSYKKGVSMKWLGAGAFVLVLASTWYAQTPHATEALGLGDKARAPSADTWKVVMLIYAFFASILPVWLLLQTRDFLNSLLLYLGMGMLYIGFFLTAPEFTAGAVIPEPKNAPPIYPFVFIIIACGAVSGFHSLVSSGTTAKQLNKETDARFIGYGGMVGESMLGLMAILATTTGLTATEWHASYGDWNALSTLGKKVSAFITGSGRFLESLSFGEEAGKGFIAFIVVSFALTSLDSATRLLRYNIEEIAEFLPGKSKAHDVVQNRYVSSLLAVIAIGFFAFFKINGKPAGIALWQLFGAGNQLLGGLALLAASVYLYSRGKNPLYTLIPMVFVMIATMFAMSEKLATFAKTDGAGMLLVITVILMAMTGWLLTEAVLAVRRYTQKKVPELDIVT